MAIKTNPISLLAGIFAPSASVYHIVKREALARGLPKAEAKGLGDQAYYAFRNAQLSARWGALASLTPESVSEMVDELIALRDGNAAKTVKAPAAKTVKAPAAKTAGRKNALEHKAA